MDEAKGLLQKENDAENMQDLRTPVGKPSAISRAMPRLWLKALETGNQALRSSVSVLRPPVAKLSGST